MEAELTARDADMVEPEEQNIADLEAEAFDLKELKDWGPIVSVAVIGALVFSLLMQLIFRIIGIPGWADFLIFVPYMCVPYFFFTWLIWDKPAVRLPDGTVLRRDEARLLALRVCASYALAIFLRVNFRIPNGLADAARWARLRLFNRS